MFPFTRSHIRQDKINVSIRFGNQVLTKLRRKLLADLTKEHYAILLAKHQQVGNLVIFTVVETRFPDNQRYKNQSSASLTVDGKFATDILNEIDRRIDVDTFIEVHTHPFSQQDAWFSAIDDRDESEYCKYIHGQSQGMYYATIVFSQTQYKARFWRVDKNGRAIHSPALIRTQKISEQIPSPDDIEEAPEVGDMFQRSVLALGLDNVRKMTSGQIVTIIGAGGLGSVIAEHLVHLGIRYINLVDFDKLELTNLNRIVGAYYRDAKKQRLKTECIKEHLQLINPQAIVNACPLNVFDKAIEPIIAESNWIFVATDNHASRYQVQLLAFKYYVPFITAGVNISVENDTVTDMSGEVILVRVGDNVCLQCLRRINYDEVAKVIHPDETVREGLVARGYVTGRDVKEPAVKTLNTHLATLAVDVFVNQFTERQQDRVITVYENNECPVIYENTNNVYYRNLKCSVCG